MRISIGLSTRDDNIECHVIQTLFMAIRLESSCKSRQVQWAMQSIAFEFLHLSMPVNVHALLVPHADVCCTLFQRQHGMIS